MPQFYTQSSNRMIRLVYGIWPAVKISRAMAQAASTSRHALPIFFSPINGSGTPLMYQCIEAQVS
jgi:hypothetical protein